jgi:hypothetical protein
MFTESFRWGVYIVGLPIIALLLVSIVRRIRAIRALDAELRAEEARNPTNPQAALARLFEDQKR